jgi:RHS repeat-associated protein
VWFDDVKVTHTYSRVTQASDYYAFGSVMREQKSPDDLVYRYGYQGQFAEKDEETGYNFFELRNYDPAIGRWTATDPYSQYWSPYNGMGNNPINSTDSDGGYSRFGAWWRSGFGLNGRVYQSGVDGAKQVWGYERDGVHYFGEDARNNYSSAPMIREWKPNFLQRWGMSDNWFAETTYEFTDGVYVTGQFFTPWKRKSHLDGRDVVGDDAAEAFAGNATNLIPASKGLKLTAPQFSKLFKGSLSKLQPKVRGVINRIMNKTVFGRPAGAVKQVSAGAATVIATDKKD